MNPSWPTIFTIVVFFVSSKERTPQNQIPFSLFPNKIFHFLFPKILLHWSNTDFYFKLEKIVNFVRESRENVFRFHGEIFWS